LALPSKLTPLIVLAVCNAVAVAACKFATGVVDDTTKGAVPVETSDVNDKALN
jgi:hypothetical protein